jgi:hypothetical protein
MEEIALTDLAQCDAAELILPPAAAGRDVAQYAGKW